MTIYDPSKYDPSKFLEKHGIMINARPTLTSNESLNRNIGLINKQVSKIKVAHNNGDIVSILDALCDLCYTTEGFVYECGLQNCMAEALEATHDANMKKARPHDSNKGNKVLRGKLVDIVNRTSLSAARNDVNDKPGPRKGQKVSRAPSKRAYEKKKGE